MRRSTLTRNVRLDFYGPMFCDRMSCLFMVVWRSVLWGVFLVGDCVNPSLKVSIVLFLLRVPTMVLQRPLTLFGTW